MNHDEDPLDELHRVREEMWREAGGTIDGLFAYIRQREAEDRKQRVVVPPPPRSPKDGREGSVA